MSKATKDRNAVNFEYIDFDKLVFLDNNPRTRTDEGKAKMAADIQADPTFYENRPTLVNLKDGIFQVYAGDLRAHAAHDVLGWAKVPCNVQANVDEVTMRRRAILDNTHRETWDNDKLSEWGYEPDDLEEMGVEWKADDEQPQTYHSANEMTEDEVNILEEFDPIGLSADFQKIVFIFDNKTKAEEWLSDKPELQVKKSRMQWEVNLSTLYI